jgi:aldehyde:ferredoxin oxidoreductase
MECFENKLLTKKDTDGIDLTFGNAEAMLQMVEMIAERKGIGDLLAEGTMRAAKKIGREAEKFAIHVKGEEVPMHDPRLKRGLALGYAVKPTGAEHMNNLHDTWTRDMPSFGIIKPVSLEDLGPRKVRLYIYKVIYEIIKNCLLLCDFVPWNENHIIEIIRAVTGWNSNLWEIMKVSERSINMARAFNVREGFTRKDDWLPDRFFHPQTSGPLSETAVDPKQLENAKTTYYGMMGWNQKGVPTRAKLEELDIPWVADKINL